MQQRICSSIVPLVGTSLFLLIAISPIYQAPSASQLCVTSSPIVSKFFVLGDLLFFTDNVDHFDILRVFNLSSGQISSQHKVASLLPSSYDVSSTSLLWAFLYDPLAMNCRVSGPANFDQDRYCARVTNLRGLIVARLSNQALLFLRPNNGKFMPVVDANNFLEMHGLVKHLDKYGLTSSLTFAQERNQFVSTHYGRHAQICLTTALHQGQCTCDSG